MVTDSVLMILSRSKAERRNQPTCANDSAGRPTSNACATPTARPQLACVPWLCMRLSFSPLLHCVPSRCICIDRSVGQRRQGKQIDGCIKASQSGGGARMMLRAAPRSLPVRPQPQLLVVLLLFSLCRSRRQTPQLPLSSLCLFPFSPALRCCTVLISAAAAPCLH